MAEKQALKEKIDVQWYRRIKRDPSFAEEHGSNGWRLFQEFMESEGDPNVPKVEKQAHIFDVTLATMYRWRREYRLLRGVH